MLSGVTLLLCCGWIAAFGAVGRSAQPLNFAPVGSMTGPAEMVKVQGGFAYIAAGKTLTIFDISNPAAPKRGGAYVFPDKIWGFNVVGSLVYVADDLSGLEILDVSNTAAPTLRGSFKTRGQAHGVAVLGTKALVADHMSGLDVLDVSNLARPVLLGSFFLEGYARDVVISGSLAYAVDSPTGFYIVDLSKPGPLEPVSTLQSANGRIVAVSEASAAQGPNIACVAGNGVLQVYDVSDPAAPVLATTYRTPGGAQRASLKGRLAYVADGQEGLQVVDLSTPSKPSIVGSYKTASPARDVAVADSLVFVVVGSGEVLILRQTPR